MRCERAQELFSDYCEGSVQTALMVPFESHLDSCEDCRLQVRDLREVWQMLDAAPLIEPPADFRAAVWRRIDAAQAEKEQQAARKPSFAFNWRSLFTRPALGWAAAILVVAALAPVVIPGPQTAARMWFPWSLFNRSAPASQPAVAVGEPRLTVRDGRTWIDLQVGNTGAADAKLDVAVTGGSAMTPRVEVPVSSGTSSWFQLTEVPASAASETIKLTVSWDQNGSRQTKELTVPAAQ